MISIGNNQRNFVRDGKPFFYLADTCWSAFTNISEEEWEYYLTYRRQQGFNQKEGLIPRSLLRNKLFQDMEEVIY